MAVAKLGISSVTRADRDFFVPVAPSETVTDVVVRMALMIEAPVFKDGNQWRFADNH